jgi:hypothetical protein
VGPRAGLYGIVSGQFYAPAVCSQYSLDKKMVGFHSRSERDSVWSASHPGHYVPATLWIGSWVGPTVDLYGIVNGQLRAPAALFPVLIGQEAVWAPGPA